MNIAILGGSFDPPHLGHLSIARQVQKIYKLDQIWLIPCYQHPFEKGLSPAHHRLAMTKYLDREGMFVSDWEITQQNISYSIDTLDYFTGYYHHQFSWIIGSDQIPVFPRWKQWEDIINRYNLIIVPRGDDTRDIAAQTKQHFHLSNLPNTIQLLTNQQIKSSPISSSDIRQRVKNGVPISGLVTPTIEAYIITHALYRQ